jgi:hypothetical protein
MELLGWILIAAVVFGVGMWFGVLHAEQQFYKAAKEGGEE